jgi:chemotaxis protein CheD
MKPTHSHHSHHGHSGHQHSSHQDEPSEGYYHPGFSAHAVKVLLGEHKISQRPDEMLVTTLGSCIAACIRDPVLQLGGA